jgi:hypothetical protein
VGPPHRASAGRWKADPGGPVASASARWWRRAVDRRLRWAAQEGCWPVVRLPEEPGPHPEQVVVAAPGEAAGPARQDPTAVVRERLPRPAQEHPVPETGGLSTLEELGAGGPAWPGLGEPGSGGFVPVPEEGSDGVWVAARGEVDGSGAMAAPAAGRRGGRGRRVAAGGCVRAEPVEARRRGPAAAWGRWLGHPGVSGWGLPLAFGFRGGRRAGAAATVGRGRNLSLPGEPASRSAGDPGANQLVAWRKGRCRALAAGWPPLAARL